MTQGAADHEAGPDVAHNPRFGRRIVQLLIAILVVFVLAVVALFTWANTLLQGERAPALVTLSGLVREGTTVVDSRTAPKVAGLESSGRYRANDLPGSGPAVPGIAGEQTA